MRVVREPFPERIASASVVTIGKFDGVHVGHRAVIGRAVERARELGAEAVAVTFDRNPLAFLRPEIAPPEIMPLDRRLALMAELGLDVTAVLDFDGHRALQPATDFVDEVLVGVLGARLVVVGSDFRFGAGGEGDPGLLRRLGAEHGFEVEVFGDVGVATDPRVSSSAIRDLTRDGRVSEAAALLGSLPAVSGEVVTGNRRGREIGFPTANLREDAAGVAPADGVYAGWLTTEGGERLPAAISVSDNPTFATGDSRRVEAYVIDGDLDLYGQHVTVEFQARIRGIAAFDSVQALVERMHADVAEARAILGV